MKWSRRRGEEESLKRAKKRKFNQKREENRE
jgi:hypothetical protein